MIVAVMDQRRDPSTRFFTGHVNHIALVVRANETDKVSVEGFVAGLALNAHKFRGADRGRRGLSSRSSINGEQGA